MRLELQARWLLLLALGTVVLALPRRSFGQAAPATSSLSVVLSATPNPVLPGQTVLLVARIANAGTAATGLISVQIGVPSSATAVVLGASRCSGTVPCRSPDYVTFELEPLAAGASAVVQLGVVVDPGSEPPSLLSATATVTANVGSASATANVVVAASAGLNVAVSGSPTQPVPGDAVTYAVTYGNAGGAPVSAVLSVPLPSGTAFVSATNGGIVTAGAVAWPLATLAPGAFDRQELTLQVAGSTASGTLLAVQASLLDPTSQKSLATSTATTLVASAPSIDLALSASPQPARPGQGIVYTVRVSNRSTTAIPGAFAVSATVPSFATAPTDYVPANGNCSSSPCRSPGAITWTVPSLAAGASTVLQYGVEVDDSVSNPAPPDGTVVTALAFSSIGGGVLASVDVPIEQAFGANLGIAGSPAQTTPGGSLTYVLTFGNGAGSPMPANLAVPLPRGTSLLSASGGGTATAGVVEWSLGTLAAGAFDRRELTLQLDPAVPSGALVVADATLLDPTTGRTLAAASDAALVVSKPEVDLAITADPDPTEPGRALVYTLVVTNRSATIETGDFTVNATVPAYTTADTNLLAPATSASCSSFPCRGPGVVNWTVPSLSPGGSTVLQYSATVDNTAENPPPSDGTVLTSIAIAPVLGNASARCDVPVSSATARNLAIGASPSELAPGATVTYSIAFANVSGAPAPALLRALLPPGLTFASATDGGAATGGAVEWDLGALAPTTSGRRQFTATVDSALPSGSLLVATVELLDPMTGASLETASTSSLVEAAPQVGLTISGMPDPVPAGQAIQYTIQVTNLGATPTGAYGVAVTPPDSASSIQSTFSAGGACSQFPCRRPAIIDWTLPSLAAGASTTLRFSAVVDDSAEYPPPAVGTLLSAEATALGVLASAAVAVTAPSGPTMVEAGPGGAAPDAGVDATVEGDATIGSDGGAADTDAEVEAAPVEPSVDASASDGAAPDGMPADAATMKSGAGGSGSGGCSCDAGGEHAPPADMLIAAFAAFATLGACRRRRVAGPTPAPIGDRNLRARSGGQEPPMLSEEC